MTGGEIVAAGKAVGAVGKKALAQDEKTKEVLLRIAEDTPEMQSAARSMAVRTAVKERVKLKLYQPFARMLGVSKVYFEDTFPQEMGVKIADIPEENLITPSASIAVPALLGLSYTFEDPTLKDLYLNLLAAASDNRRTDEAHPAFAEVIKQLAPAEARLLNEVLARSPTAAVRLTVSRNRFTSKFGVLITNLLPISDETTSNPKEVPQAPTWVDNWIRLGLVEVSYDEVLSSAHAYDWVKARPEYVSFVTKVANPNHARINIDKGLIRITNFGRQFLRAVS